MPEHSIRELANAIHKLHGCDSTHIGTVTVTETFEDEVVWTGEVEIFELIDHPITQRAYAWAYETDSGKLRHVAVLHKPPVDSARAAVRAVIAAESRANN